MRRLVVFIMTVSLTLLSTVSFALEVTQVVLYPSSATVAKERMLQDERIKVKFKGAEPEVQPDKKGFLKWKIKVPPQGKAQVSHSFSVKYPKGMKLNHPF